MISIENQYGTVEISQEYFSNLVGKAASECFGVVGMVSSPAQGLRAAIRGKKTPDEGCACAPRAAGSSSTCTSWSSTA